MSELVITVIKVDTHILELGLKISNLFFECVNFALGVSSVSDFERIDFLCKHEHSILGHVFGCVILQLREQMFSFDIDFN